MRSVFGDNVFNGNFGLRELQNSLVREGRLPVPNLYGLSFSGERSASYSRRAVTELFLK